MTTKNKFKWPLVGETELSIEIAANQSWASQNGGSTTTSLSQSVRPTVPAHSKIPVKIELYKADISYPYEFKADVSYDGVVAQISQQIMISPAPSDRYTRGFLTGRPRVFSLFIALTYAITSPT